MADCQYCNKGRRYENTDLSFGQRVHVRTDATMTGVISHIHNCKEFSWVPYRVAFDDGSASASYAADELVALDKEPRYKVGERVFINSTGHVGGNSCPDAGKYATIKLVHEERWFNEPTYTVWVDGDTSESYNFEESHLDKAVLSPEKPKGDAKFVIGQRVKLAGTDKVQWDWQSATIQDMTYRDEGHWSYLVLFDNDAEGWYSERGLEAFEPEPKFTKDQRVRVTDTNASRYSQDGTIVSVQQHWPTNGVWSYHVKFDNGVDYDWYAESVLVELPSKPSPKLIVIPDEYWPQFLEFCETNNLPLKEAIG